MSKIQVIDGEIFNDERGQISAARTMSDGEVLNTWICRNSSYDRSSLHWRLGLKEEHVIYSDMGIIWGNMLKEAQEYTNILYRPWLLTPGFLIFVAVLSFNLIGDTIRDILDPKSKVR